MADGYRDGLSQSKAQVIQTGFDQGYPIGVDISLGVGRVLGFLEGLVAGLKRSAADEELQRRVQRLLTDARRELGREALMQDMEETEVMRDGGVKARVEGVVSKWERAVLGEWAERGLTR